MQEGEGGVSLPGHDTGACGLEGQGDSVLVLGGGKGQGRQHAQEHVCPVRFHRLVVCIPVAPQLLMKGPGGGGVLRK